MTTKSRGSAPRSYGDGEHTTFVPRKPNLTIWFGWPINVTGDEKLAAFHPLKSATILLRRIEVANEKVAIKSYKFKLRPSCSLILQFENMLALCCELYNAGLQERRDAWALCRRSISYIDQQSQFPDIRKLRPDIAALPVWAAREPLRRIDKAFKAFYRRAKSKKGKPGFPRFKSARRYDS